ncbi:MAG: ABC transporter permease [Erysipelotrichaceae bacterium]
MKKIKSTVLTIFRFLKNSPKTTIGLILVLLILILTLGAEFFTTHDPMMRYTGEYHTAPNSQFILGTTRLGRDVWSQTLYGGRVSILVGVMSAMISTIIGLAVGISSGYFGGIFDSIISAIINVFMVVPQLVLLLIIASMMGGVSPVIIAAIIGLTSWAYNARILRAQTMSIRNREFIYSAETLGESKFRILFVEIMPNMLSIITTSFIGTIIYAIMAQSFMEMIGFGDPLSVTWGTMLYNAQSTGALNSGIWWEVLGPGLAIIILGAGLTLINFSIDEVSNPKLKAQRIMSIYNKLQKKKNKSPLEYGANNKGGQ